MARQPETRARHLFTRMGRICRLGLSAILCGSALAGPMDLGGQFSVNESGAATYTVPIRIPPGTAGIEPKLALSYHSQGGNGLLGVGWSLSGLSAITRCPRTAAQDGVRGSITLGATDRFCLDGQRLMSVSGTYGANGTSYRTERDAFSKIVSYGSTGSGPAWFKVWTKSGQIIEYGNTADSFVEVQGKAAARAWAINKLSDTKGNYYAVAYTEDGITGEHTPSRIDYTGNTATGVAPAATISFVYEARPDIFRGYYLGGATAAARRLKTIQIATGNTAVRELRIDYQTGASTQRSRIAALRECAADTNTCTPPIVVTWSETPATPDTAKLWSSLLPAHIADVNGDGRNDLIGILGDGLQVALSRATGADTSTRWGSNFGSGQGYADANINPVMLADVNADGLADAVGFAGDGVYVALSTGTAFAAAGKWLANFGTGTGWTNMDAMPRTLADMNGDGRPDVVGFKTDGVYVGLNTGSAISAPTRWLADFGTTTATAYPTATANPRFVLDLNGDGLPDVAGLADSGVYVAINSGTALAAATLWLADFGSAAGWTSTDAMPRTFGDVNGDGLPDLVGFKNDGTYVALNTGAGFQPATKWLDDFGAGTATAYATQQGFPRQLADMNSDGRADIVGFGTDGLRVARSTGTGFAPASLWFAGFSSANGYTNAASRKLADLDGDGAIDLIGMNDSGINIVASAWTTPPDVALRLTGGLGLTTEVAYAPLTADGQHTKGSGAAYPQLDATLPLFVVSTLRTPNGLGTGFTTTTYKYGGLRLDLAGRGALGFGTFESKQVDTGIATRTYYRQDWPYAGLPDRTMRFIDGSSSFLSLVSHTYACLNPQTAAACTIGTGKTYFPYLSQRIDADWDLNGAALPVVTTKNTYDSYGNATQIVRSVDDGTSVTTTNTYTNDSTNWILGRLTRSQVAATTGGTPTGTSNGLFTFSPVLAANVNNYNLKNAAIAAGWDQNALLFANVTIATGTVVGSTSTANAAFITGTGFPNGSRLTLTNNGTIIGRGGTGAGGANVTTTTFNGAAATAGGLGFSAQTAIAVTNNGTIAGGGGGGGAGNGYKANIPWPIGGGSMTTAHAGSGGGGGGAGGGTAGSAGNASGASLMVSGLAGSAGTATSGGAGGGIATAYNYATLKANAGGAGGGPGQAGQAGSSSYSAATIAGATQFGGVATPAAPGAAGPAVTGNANIVWITRGSVLGAVK